MRFDPATAYRASTSYTHTVPQHFEHLLLPGFAFEFVHGRWGNYLSLWFETSEFVFWLHYFSIQLQLKLYPHTPVPLFVLHHLIRGSIYGEINQSIPVNLSEDWSHFIAIPARQPQEAYFSPGQFISCHADFKKDFLGRHGSQYPAIASVIDSFEKDPSKAFSGPAVLHDHRMNHLWRTIPSDLKSVSSPELYLSARCRELFRTHCEHLSSPTLSQTEEALRLQLSPKELMAVQQVKNLLERDVSKRHSIPELAAKTGLNMASLKHAFKTVYHLGIHQYLVNQRLEFGYQLILTTNDPIKSIARACGYENTSHFNFLFKRKYNIEPTQLRTKES